MGVLERREREKSEVREKILDAARELFIREGYEGVSMRMVANKIEYSPTAIYGHFADKEDLFLQLCHEDFLRLAGSFNQLAQIADPIERVRQLGTAYVEFGTKFPNHYRMMFMTPHPRVIDTPEIEERMGKGNPEEDSYEMLRQTVAEGIQAGAYRKDLTDPDLVAQTLWAGVHGVISLEIAKKEDNWVNWCPIDERARIMLDGLLHGLLRKEQ
ncbi:MAG TPA: TetR/AcrR family transcriptional regulator [Terriglobales bacterium]|jgi:AcrR family transcriptional regulator|nr:TetR/AcrR family transcriptional regulator [Terriglobales bacterium]